MPTIIDSDDDDDEVIYVWHTKISVNKTPPTHIWGFWENSKDAQRESRSQQERGVADDGTANGHS